MARGSSGSHGSSSSGSSGSSSKSNFGSGSSSSSGSGSDVPVEAIIYLALFAGFMGSHIWRHYQTKAKSHMQIAGGALVGAVAFGLLIAGSQTRDLNVLLSFSPVLVVCALILRCTTTFFLVQWTRSMSKVIPEKCRAAFRLAASSLGIYIVASILVIAGAGLYISALNSMAQGKSVYSLIDQANASVKLTRAGYGVLIAFDLLLAGTSAWLFAETPNNGTPGMIAKRRQTMVLAVLFTALFASDLSIVLNSLHPYVIFLLLFLLIGLYPLHALTGFDCEPDLTAGAPIVPQAGVVYVQQQPPQGALPPAGAVYAQPAMMTPQPGVVYSQPGVPYSQPGVAYSQPGVAYAQPGVPYSQPGVVYSQPGVAYAQPGVAYPSGADLNYRDDPSSHAAAPPPPQAPIAGVAPGSMPEPVVTPSAMSTVPLSSAAAPPPPATAPYPQS